MLKDYLLDRLPKVRVLDVHDDPMHERLRVRLVPGGRQPIDHAYSFRRCLDEVPKTHTEKGDTIQLLGDDFRIPGGTGMDRTRLSSPVLFG